MNVEDFEFIAKLLKERSGLVLGKDKAYLLESRLNPVARKWQFKGFDDLAEAVRVGNDEALVNDITEAMTTNESFFFRDTKPFDQFRDPPWGNASSVMTTYPGRFWFSDPSPYVDQAPSDGSPPSRLPVFMWNSASGWLRDSAWQPR